MSYAAILFNPHIFGLVALFLSVLWMLRDEQDKTRPALVIGLVINLFYGLLLNLVMGRENGLLPWKYDHVLAALDAAAGVDTPGIASSLQGQWRVILGVVYDLMVPMMIVWYFVARQDKTSGSIVVAYIAEMVAGPLLYAVVPACGPVYAFRGSWLHPAPVSADLVRLTGMPNAFPSLHVGTAMLFVLFSRRWRWRLASLLILVATLAATLATGEHYAVDLAVGILFGCFAAYAGKQQVPSAAFYLGLAACWSLAVRFQFAFLIDNPVLLRCAAGLSALAGFTAICSEWISHAPSPRAAQEDDLGARCSWQEPA